MINQLINKVLKVYCGLVFSPPRESLDILRSAYITNFYNDARHNLKEKDELAKLMRHSAKIAQREYQKIDVSNVPHPDNLVVSIPELVPEPVVVNRSYFNLKEWRKEYRYTHKDEINNKAKEDYKVNKDEILKRHILGNLNRSQTQRNQNKHILINIT